MSIEAEIGGWLLPLRIRPSKKIAHPMAGHGHRRDLLPSLVHQGLRSPGQSLDVATRPLLERNLRYDFSSVRVHTDSIAAESARMVGARAYTIGRDVVFSSGEFNPETTMGRRLIAHELAHVVQQSQAAPVQCGFSGTGAAEAAEREAKAAENAIDPMSSKRPSEVRCRVPCQIQRVEAIEPLVSRPDVHELSDKEIQDAIKYNHNHIKRTLSYEIIRDVIGLPKTSASSDKELAIAVARWQADYGLAQDGKLGKVTVTYIIEELQAEGEDASAILLMSEFPKGTLLDIDTSFCVCKSALQHQIEIYPEIGRLYIVCAQNERLADIEQLQNCVISMYSEAHGVLLESYGSTSPSGQSQTRNVPGRCGRLAKRIAEAHEQVHSVTDKELMEIYGAGTRDFNRIYSNLRRVAKDEVKAYATARLVCRWMLGILQRICP